MKGEMVSDKTYAMGLYRKPCTSISYIYERLYSFAN